MYKRYNSDNGVFILDSFRSSFQGKKHTRYFSGVGVKHQNSKAERAIQTIRYWSRKMMTHADLHCPDDSAYIVRLWKFAVTHAAWLNNYLTNNNMGWMSPLEIFAKTDSDHHDILSTLV